MRFPNTSTGLFVVALFAVASLFPLATCDNALAQGRHVPVDRVQIDGQSCTMVTFKVDRGKSTDIGILQVVGRGKQLEWQLVLSDTRSSKMVYQKAIERDRDQWSVYLDSESHSVSIDLYQKKVKFDGESFPILSSSNQTITHSVNQIKIADSESNKTIKLEKTGASTWNLLGSNGTEPLKVVEMDQWLLCLAKESDLNNEMQLQVDFYKNKASSGGHDMGAIASFSGDDRRPEAVQINEKPNQPRESKPVDAIDYERPGDGSFKGRFVKTGVNTWEERNREGVHQFREQSRTGSCVTLKKTDGLVLVIDLDGGEILRDSQVLYRVTAIGGSATKENVTPNDKKSSSHSVQSISQITWSTSGGGQLEFDLGKTANGDFAYRIRSYDFEDFDKDKYLQGEITAADRELHQLLSDIFAGRHDLAQHKFSYEGRLGGTWTKLTAYRGQEQETIQISGRGKLGVIGDFMAKAAKAAK